MDGAVAIVLAAGSGERMSGLGPKQGPKAFLDLGGRPMLAWAVETAARLPLVASIVVAVPEGFESEARAALALDRPVAVVEGGDSRQASVRAALAAVSDDAPFVVCHDAARPFATAELFLMVLSIFEHFPEADGAIPVLPIADTVKRIDEGGFVVATETRTDLVAAQTPQAFRTGVLRGAHEAAAAAGLEFTDDAALLEWAGSKVKAVAGEGGNFKITTPDDLARARVLAVEARRG